MRKIEAVIFDVNDLAFSSRLKSISDIDVYDLTYEAKQEFKQADLAVFTNLLLQTKIMKDRYGDRGRAWLTAHIIEVID